MPELPEVETIRKTLKQLILQKTIEDVEIYWGNIIKLPKNSEEFRLLLIDQTFQRIGRRGKFLLFYLDDYVLVSHLRMEGKYYLIEDEEADKHKHTHVVFKFTDGTALHYNDVRKFGTMHLFQIGEEHHSKPLDQLGPDPFEDHFTVDYIEKKFSRTRRAIKAVLLDQTIIAGLGNIYVDEVLFLAKIHPEKRANTLSRAEIFAIKKYSEEVLAKATELGGTTIRSYLDGIGEMGMFQQQLHAYGQEGKQCSQCEAIIIKLKVAGRGTHICPICQKNS